RRGGRRVGWRRPPRLAAARPRPPPRSRPARRSGGGGPPPPPPRRWGAPPPPPRRGVGRRLPPRACQRQLPHDELFVLENHHPLDHVLELADVARPVVGLKELLKLLRRAAPRPVVPPRVAVDEELGEVGDLVAAFAQRRHRDL